MARNILISTRSPKSGNLPCYQLPKGEVTLTITQIPGSPNPLYELNDPEVKLVPDPEHQYYLNYNPSAFSDDDITVELHPNGVIKRLHTLIDDQTDDFLAKLGELGTSVAQVAMGAPKTRSTDGPIIIYSGTIDPFDKEDLSHLNRRLKAIDKNLDFKTRIMGTITGEGVSEATNSDRSGIFCKPQATCELSLSYGEGRVKKTVNMPHPDLLHFIEVPQASWVKTEFEIKFDETGYPNYANVKKPSTAMSIIELPIKIIGSILELPAKLFKFRFDLDNSYQKSYEHKINYASKMQELAESQRKMQEEAQTRGLFGFGSGSKKASEPSQAAPASNAPAANQTQVDELTNLVKKLQQDLDIMRKRANEK